MPEEGVIERAPPLVQRAPPLIERAPPLELSSHTPAPEKASIGDMMLTQSEWGQEEAKGNAPPGFLDTPFLRVPHMPRPTIGEPTLVQEALRGIQNKVADFVEGATTPKGMAILGATAVAPEVAVPLLSVPMAVTGAQETLQGVKEGDVAKTAGGILQTFAGAAGLVKPVESAIGLIKRAPATAAALERGGATLQEATKEPALPTEPVAEGGAAAATPKIEPTPAGKVEPAGESKGVATLPGNDPASLGIRAPLSLPGMSAMHDLVVGGTEQAKLFLKGAAGEALPRTVAANPEAGEAGVSFASARVAAPLKAQLFVQDALRGTEVDPVKFGAALTEDNLRSVKEQRLAAGEDPADVNVSTIIGKRGSPFATEADYQAFLADPETQQAVTQYKATWDAVKEPQYRLAASIDPATPLASRGLQTGARVNLYAIKEGEPLPTGTRIAGGGGGGNLLATLKRKSQFARKATGESDSYVIDLRDIMAHSMEGEYAIAMKNKMDNALVKNGDAAIVKVGQDAPTLKGEPTVPFPYRRLTIVKEGEPAVPLNANIYVRKSLAQEYRAVHGTDAPLTLPGFTKVGEKLTRASLVGFSEGTIHISNLLTGVLTRPGPTSSLLANTALKAFGRADVIPTLVNVIRNALTASTKQLTSMAEIGALKEPYKGTMLAPIISRIDQGVRVTLDNVYQGLKEKGLVEDTPAARREFISQVGQYNKRLQGPLIRALRESQIGPFATAGRAFNVLAARTAALSPGVKATSAAHAAALRAEAAAGILGVAAIAASWNYMKTGQVDPPGVRLGDLYLSTDENGRQRTLALADLMGYGRALRVTGTRGFIEAKRAGLPTATAIDKGLENIASSAISPAIGPAIRTGLLVATGKTASIPSFQEAPVMEPGSNVPQIVANAGYAATQANPVGGTLYDIYQGKLPSEIAARQLTRFAPRSSPSPDLIEALPRIVGRQQMEDYVDDVARRARKLKPAAADALFDRAREAVDNMDDPKLRREGREKLKMKQKYQ